MEALIDNPTLPAPQKSRTGEMVGENWTQNLRK